MNNFFSWTGLRKQANNLIFYSVFCVNSCKAFEVLTCNYCTLRYRNRPVAKALVVKKYFLYSVSNQLSQTPYAMINHYPRLHV